MREQPRPKITKETVQRMAQEQAGLTLTDANLDALVPLVSGLQDYASAVVAIPGAPPPRAGVRTGGLDGWLT